jgi:hypothetical protein
MVTNIFYIVPALVQICSSPFAFNFKGGNEVLQKLKRRWDSSIGITTSYRLDCRGSIPGRGKLLFYSTTSIPTLRTTQSPMRLLPAALSPGGKVAGGESDHTNSSIVQFKNCADIPPLSLYIFMA